MKLNNLRKELKPRSRRYLIICSLEIYFIRNIKTDGWHLPIKLVMF